MYRPTNISSSAPTVNDDYSVGFRNGNFWWNTTNEVLYILEDQTTGNAVWTNTISGENLGQWASWTPTYIWVGGTPVALTTIGRYCAVGDTTYIILNVKGTAPLTNITDMWCTLPVEPANTSARVPLTFYSNVTGTGVGKDHFAIVETITEPRMLWHVCFQVIPASANFELYYSGFYETA
jgi:hypothetical protein